MFHKFTGQIFFWLLATFFFLVSVQNTWAFLNTALPDSTPFFLGGLMFVYEGGVLGWLALLMHGTENIPRTIIAGLMLVVSVIGVATGAYFELGSQMHKGIAARIDPGFLANVPDIVIFTYLSMLVAFLLYLLASPHFAARLRTLDK